MCQNECIKLVLSYGEVMGTTLGPADGFKLGGKEGSYLGDSLLSLKGIMMTNRRVKCLNMVIHCKL